MKTSLRVFFLLALCSSLAFADKLYLKGGKILKTTIVREEEQCVMIENDDAWQTINKCDIVLIRKGDGVPVEPNIPSPAQPPLPATEEVRPAKPAEAPASLVGIGVYLSGRMVSMVMPDTPASDAGIMKGDKIVAVDGENVFLGSTLKERLRGEAGTKVNIKVSRPGMFTPIEMTLVREYLPRMGAAGTAK